MITPTECIVISQVAFIACGCIPPDFTCSICGEGMVPTELNATFIPGEALTCGEAHASGTSGDLTPTECSLYEPLALLRCECEEDTTSMDAPTMSPAGDGTMSPSIPGGTPTDADRPTQGSGTPPPSGESVDSPAVSVATRLSYLSSILILWVPTMFV
jgi:hypothetical protein